MDTTFRVASNFKGIIDIISAFTDTMTIQYNSDGMSIQSMDGSHISMLYIMLRRDQFLDYKVNSSGTISYNVNSFKPVIKSMREGDHLRIRHSVGSDELDIYLIDGDRKNKYQIKLLDIDTEHLNMDAEMEHDVFISTGKAAISRILNDIKNVDSSDTTLTVEGDKIVIEAKSDQCTLKMKPTADLMRIMSAPEEKVSALYSSRYILHIQKMLAISKQRINLKIDSECPLLVEMTIRTDEPSENVNQKIFSSMKYFLAPKIDVE